MEPRDTDPVADREPRTAGPDRVDDADHLVTGDDGKDRQLELARDDVQIRPTARAGVDPDADLSLGRLRVRALLQGQRTPVDAARGVEHLGSHGPRSGGVGGWATGVTAPRTWPHP
jgi:hypothetical protein